MGKGISVFTDGGARGNPGPAAAAFIVKDGDGNILHKDGKLIGNTTNNVAEYSAVIEALNWLKDNLVIIDHKPALPAGRSSIINFYLDSQLVVNQLTGKFKIKDVKLRRLVIIVKSLEKRLSQKIVYNLIPREDNKIADTLINQTLDLFMS